ncbi:10228_t:CDS:2 [Cetraspora pellucida]|uniref:10228_t:CDS:1 n=1 Tax=Cetraspora pellucida TaxID=1433469 RepID=A0ACA9M730_9GLOM|nr:10228_t:CDS:2 [Cetraspora pellucida]
MNSSQNDTFSINVNDPILSEKYVKHHSDVPTISAPRSLQRSPTPIYGIQRPLTPYSPTNSNRMLLSSPSPTRTTFSTQLSPPLSPTTPTFPKPLSPIISSFINPPPVRISFIQNDHDQQISSLEGKLKKPRPSTFGSFAEIKSHSPSTQLEIEILEDRDE